MPTKIYTQTSLMAIFQAQNLVAPLTLNLLNGVGMLNETRICRATWVVKQLIAGNIA